MQQGSVWTLTLEYTSRCASYVELASGNASYVEYASRNACRDMTGYDRLQLGLEELDDA